MVSDDPFIRRVTFFIVPERVCIGIFIKYSLLRNEKVGRDLIALCPGRLPCLTICILSEVIKSATALAVHLPLIYRLRCGLLSVHGRVSKARLCQDIAYLSFKRDIPHFSLA